MGKDKKRKKFVEEESQFTKTDMQRLGVFKEGGYVSIGDEYRTARSEYLNCISRCTGRPTGCVCISAVIVLI